MEVTAERDHRCPFVSHLEEDRPERGRDFPKVTEIISVYAGTKSRAHIPGLEQL